MRTFAGTVALIVTAGALVWFLFAVLKPLPGRDLAIATGPAGSVYAQVAERYREILARDGVRLRLVPTNGAVENLRRLNDPQSGVEAGFVQAGTTSEDESPDLASLGTTFYEPLWAFCRCTALPEVIFKPDTKVSVGREGSATRPLALRLLALNGVHASQLNLEGYLPEEAAQKLIAGDIQVAVLLSAWDASAVQRLLRAPGVELLGFRRADAYVALDPKFNKLVLPQGIADLAANRPPADVPLIASKASLVVRRDLHSALQYLLLRAAIEVHSPPAIFQRAGEFPAPEAIDLPISPEAAHVYKSGPSILRRTLPFWLAELIQRLLIIVLPVAGILYPLWSLLPKFYRWQMQRRIYRLYGELRLIERTLQNSVDPQERARSIARFHELERRVMNVKVPKSFFETSFNLRMHIRALADNIRKDV
jgi:TRAP-type uncharacterized transport system substrate-binding protein